MIYNRYVRSERRRIATTDLTTPQNKKVDTKEGRTVVKSMKIARTQL